jgi:hypothetical protein
MPYLSSTSRNPLLKKIKIKIKIKDKTEFLILCFSADLWWADEK